MSHCPLTYARIAKVVEKSAKGSKARFASVKVSKSGKVTLKTRGKAKKLHVKLSLKASATTGFEAYSYTNKWKVK